MANPFKIIRDIPAVLQRGIQEQGVLSWLLLIFSPPGIIVLFLFPELREVLEVMTALGVFAFLAFVGAMILGGSALLRDRRGLESRLEKKLEFGKWVATMPMWEMREKTRGGEPGFPKKFHVASIMVKNIGGETIRSVKVKVRDIWHIDSGEAEYSDISLLIKDSAVPWTDIDSGDHAYFTFAQYVQKPGERGIVTMRGNGNEWRPKKTGRYGITVVAVGDGSPGPAEAIFDFFVYEDDIWLVGPAEIEEVKPVKKRKRRRPANLKSAREKGQLEEFAKNGGVKSEESFFRRILGKMLKGSKADEGTSPQETDEDCT